MSLNRREFLHRAPLLAGMSLLAAEAGVSPTRAASPPSTRTIPPSVPAAPVMFQNAHLHNVDHLDPAEGGEGMRMNRVPLEVWEKMNAAGKIRAFAAGGSELRFNLVGKEVRVFLRFVENRGNKASNWPVLAELYQGGLLMRCIPFGETWTEIVIKAPSNLAALSAEAAGRGTEGFDPALVRLAFPYMPETQILKIEGDIAPPRPEQLPARRYLAYGSSITHGSYALRTGETYPAQIGRAFDVDVLNQGFGAAAFLEPEMAAWFSRRRDWDFATLELGVNLLRPLSTEVFAKRVDVFLKTIVAGRPDAPIFVIDIFTSGKDFEADPKRPEFRRVVREAVAALKSPHVFHLEGLKLLTKHSGLCFDLLHPSSQGFAEISTRLATAMESALPALVGR